MRRLRMLSGPVADPFRTLRAMVDPNGCSDLTGNEASGPVGSLVPHPGAIHHHAVQRLGPDHQPWRRIDTRESKSQFWRELVESRKPGDLSLEPPARVLFLTWRLVFRPDGQRHASWRTSSA